MSQCRTPLARLLLSSAFVATALPAQASETRKDAFGGSWGIGDTTDLFQFPARVGESQAAHLELGSAGAATDAYGGVTARLSKFSLGAFAGRNEALFTSNFVTAQMRQWLAPITTAPAALIAPERPLELYASFNAGVPLGVGLVFAGARNETATDPTYTRQNSTQLGLKASAILAVGAANLDLGLSLGALETTEAKTLAAAGGTETKTLLNAGRPIELSARYETPTGYGRAFGVAYVNTRIGAKFESANRSAKLAENVLALSGGMVFEERDSYSVLAEVRVPYTTYKGPQYTRWVANATDADTTVSHTNMGIDVNAGAEARIYSFMGILGGFSYPVWMRGSETDNTTPKTTTATSLPGTNAADRWRIGAYFSGLRWRVDALLSGRALLHNGPFLIAGNATAPLFAKLSARVDFGDADMGRPASAPARTSPTEAIPAAPAVAPEAATPAPNAATEGTPAKPAKEAKAPRNGKKSN